jgi:hypothetical protein
MRNCITQSNRLVNVEQVKFYANKIKDYSFIKRLNGQPGGLARKRVRLAIR